MKTRFCLGIALMIVLLVLGICSARVSQVNAARVQAGAPAENWVTDFISDTPDAGSHVSIAIDEDHDNAPWVAYYNRSNSSLMVARFVGAGDGNCDANDAWLCIEVDQVDGESKGLYTSIAVFPDINPDPLFSTWQVGVSYFDASHKSLKYARYRCQLGNCTWTIQTVDSSADGADYVGQYSSLKFGSDGTAHISYYMYDAMGDFRRGIVKYAYRLGDSSGNCGDDNDWACQEIDGAYVGVGTLFGAYTSLDLDDENRTFISYYDGNNGDLKYTYYVGFGGSCGNAGDWNCVTIDDGGGDDVGLFTSLHARNNADDDMKVAYYNRTAGTLMYAYQIGSSGNCGLSGSWQCNVIEEIGADISQLGISLVVGPGDSPVIAYSYTSSSVAPMGLRIAQPAYFASYANCGGEMLYDWWCRDVEKGGAYQEEAQFLGLAIRPNGLPIIAYSELDTYAYPEKLSLKIAYQVVMTTLPLVVK